MFSGCLNGQKFSLDDDHILALNYENLCDGDYLSRLFTSAAYSDSVLKERTNQSVPLSCHNLDADSVSVASDKLPGKNNAWLLVAGLPEALVLFGNENPLGSEYIMLRSLRELEFLKSFELLSNVTEKQIVLFEYIANLLLKKYDHPLPSPIFCPLSSTSSTSSCCAGSPMGHLISDTLLCTLKILEERSANVVHLIDIEPILSFITRLSFESFNGTKGDVVDLSYQHRTVMLNILCNIVNHSLCTKFKNVCTVRDGRSLLKLALRCSYAMLVLGLHSKDFYFILSTVTHLLSTNVLLNGWHGKLIEQVSTQKEEFSLLATSGLGQDKLSVKAKLLLNHQEKVQCKLDCVGNKLDTGESMPSMERACRDGGESRDVLLSRSWKDNNRDTTKPDRSEPSIPRCISTPPTVTKLNNNNNQFGSPVPAPFRSSKKTAADNMTLAEKVALKSMSGSHSFSFDDTHLDFKNVSLMTEVLSMVI